MKYSKPKVFKPTESDVKRAMNKVAELLCSDKLIGSSDYPFLSVRGIEKLTHKTMKHPNPKIQTNQDEFLKNCPNEQKEFHERFFRIGNAAYIYHQQANSIDDKTAEKYFHEWLEGLPVNIKNDMQKKGYEACKTILSFTRYVNERCDIGMDEWMKNHLSEEDYQAWIDAGKDKT